MDNDCQSKPRGGTSKGGPITLDTEPSEQWQRLQEAGISDFERDRRAILAMAGGYRTSFEFVETIGYETDYQLARPYHSWGTEYVYVVEDRGDFISLQHIMVMVIEQDDGTLSEPMVMKHWRQDWHYEDQNILEYAGDKVWQNRPFKKGDIKGTWSQSVYQVDDSPRYASTGKWTHNGSYSAWTSAMTRRPLPRREHSVRSDYQIMDGINRHIILPTGWIQEEENFKKITDKNGVRYLAKELGNNRYQRITDFDWSAGDEYWDQTRDYWAEVRRQWKVLAEKNSQFSIVKPDAQPPLFMTLFGLAEAFKKGSIDDLENAVADGISDYIETNTSQSR